MDEQSEWGCSCLTYIIATFTVATITLIGFYDFLKSMLGSLMVTFLFIPLALFGLVPVGGQMAYRAFTPGIITWAFGVVQIDPTIRLSLPEWIDFLLTWIIESPHKIEGTIESYVYAVGYTEAIGISAVILLRIMARLFGEVGLWIAIILILIYFVAKIFFTLPF